jgi:hypothetical protein
MLYFMRDEVRWRNREIWLKFGEHMTIESTSCEQPKFLRSDLMARDWMIQVQLMDIREVSWELRNTEYPGYYMFVREQWLRKEVTAMILRNAEAGKISRYALQMNDDRVSYTYPPERSALTLTDLSEKDWVIIPKPDVATIQDWYEWNRSYYSDIEKKEK